MVSQLIRHERIETTVQKAKELRRIADQMVTLGKQVRACGPRAPSSCRVRYSGMGASSTAWN